MNLIYSLISTCILNTLKKKKTTTETNKNTAYLKLLHISESLLALVIVIIKKKTKKKNTKTLKTAEESELGAVMGNVEVTQHSLILCTISHTEMMENNTV